MSEIGMLRQSIHWAVSSAIDLVPSFTLALCFSVAR